MYTIELRKSHVLWTTSAVRNSPSINNIFTRVKLFPGVALFRHSLPLFFARIFPAPPAAGVLWVAVAHPLPMHRRAPHACASCSQDIALSYHVAAIRYVPLLDLSCSAPLCATPRCSKVLCAHISRTHVPRAITLPPRASRPAFRAAHVPLGGHLHPRARFAFCFTAGC